ncbi:MAG: hypothetical protein ABJH08_13125 [Balneola sp.]
MSCKYIYIDDEDKDLVQPYIDSVQKAENLVIERLELDEFSKLISKIIKADSDGILIDWKLDEKAIEGWQFKAAPVAQELRIKSSENINLAKPIILISTNEKLRETYSIEKSSHDLFDYLYLKSDVIERGEEIGQELIAFADSYKRLRDLTSTKTSFEKILGLKNEEQIDTRILASFSNGEDQLPVHEYAQFIIYDLLKVPGPLVKEETLASRLGVEMNDNWDDFKTKQFDFCKYTGPFESIFNRWWFKDVERWWEEKVESKKPLQLLKADERVSRINEKIGADLKAVNPISKGYSGQYWTVCQDLNLPLDPIDGFMIAARKSFPWQEERYISKKSAVERTFKNKGLSIHILEKERYLGFMEDE